MNTLAVLRALGPVDARSVSRDSMLRWTVVMMPAFALGYRFIIPPVAAWLDARFGVDLVPYYGLVMSTVGLVAVGIIGVILGFLILDQRDDQTLPALLVTPLSLRDYVAYRLSVPTALAVLLTILMFPLAGLTRLTVPQVLVCSVCAAPLAAIYTLFIGAFARNKVQGLALGKATGIFTPPAIASYFLPMPWQTLAGILPHYWPMKAFWLFHEGRASAYTYAAIGFAYQVVLLWVLARYFARVMRR